MWTAPVAQEVYRSDRIACIHMSGLLVRSLWTAGQDGFRDASSNQPRDLGSADGSHGMSRTSDRSILPSAPLAAWARPSRGEPRLADLSGGSRGCSLHPCAVVTLPRHHQLPGRAGILVGERHRCEFGRLALQKGYQPGRRMTSAVHGLRATGPAVFSQGFCWGYPRK